MAISTGDMVPEANLTRLTENGPEIVQLSERLKGRNVVVFGVPGAFSGTCSTAHVPSFIRTKDQFAAKGVDEIICVSVNDPFVMLEWGKATGATEAGISMLADVDGSFAKEIGMDFDAPVVGFFGRFQRFAMHVVDGEVKVIQADNDPGQCNLSGGESILDAI